MKHDAHIHTSYVAAAAVERDTTYICIYIIVNFFFSKNQISRI
jgi:hypothetical protein